MANRRIKASTNNWFWQFTENYGGELGSGRITVPDPIDWEGTRPDSECQWQGGYVYTQPSNVTYTDNTPSPPEVYNFAGWWSFQFQPLTGQPTTENGTLTYGDSDGFIHQPTTTSHWHMRNFWTESNNVVNISILNELHPHDKNEYYDLKVVYFEVPAGALSPEGIENIDQYRNRDGNATSYDTIYFSMSHYQTDLNGVWHYRIDDSTVSDFIFDHEDTPMCMYLFEFDY